MGRLVDDSIPQKVKGKITGNIAEQEITALPLAAPQIGPFSGQLVHAPLQATHRCLFSDIFEWAGETRWVNISKGDFFCRNEVIENGHDTGSPFKRPLIIEKALKS